MYQGKTLPPLAPFPPVSPVVAELEQGAGGRSNPAPTLHPASHWRNAPAAVRAGPFGGVDHAGGQAAQFDTCARP